MEGAIHITHSRLLESVQGAGLQQHEQEHLAVCEDCAFNLDWMMTIEGMRSLAAFPEPPPSLVNAAIGLATAGRREPLLRRLQAILTFDSFAAPQPAGIRPGHSDVRHLIYKGSILEITLQVNTNAANMTIIGQLAAAPDNRIVPQARVRLLDDESGRIETHSDGSGQFLFESIPVRDYSCEVDCRGVGVSIDRLPPPPVKKI